MPRHDVYRMSAGPISSYYVDVQSDLLDQLTSRAVVPLSKRPATTKLSPELNPIFDINGDDYVMVTQLIVAVPAKSLVRPVCSLRHERDAITRALDVLLVGF